MLISTPLLNESEMRPGVETLAVNLEFPCSLGLHAIERAAIYRSNAKVKTERSRHASALRRTSRLPQACAERTSPSRLEADAEPLDANHYIMECDEN